jgi:hypothetical protein
VRMRSCGDAPQALEQVTPAYRRLHLRQSFVRGFLPPPLRVPAMECPPPLPFLPRRESQCAPSGALVPGHHQAVRPLPRLRREMQELDVDPPTGILQGNMDNWEPRRASLRHPKTTLSRSESLTLGPKYGKSSRRCRSRTDTSTCTAW